MKTMQKLVLAAGLACLPFTANSQEVGKTYLDIGFTTLTVKDQTGTLGSFSPGAIKLTGGLVVIENLALEVMVGAGVSDSTKRIGSGSVTVGASNFYGAFAKPFYKISDKVTVFGRGGYFHGTLDVSAVGAGGSAALSTSDGGFAYGMGASVYLSDNISLVADWGRYFDKNNVQITGFGFGTKLDF